MENKVKNNLIFVGILTVVVFCLVFPQPINQGINWFKEKGVPLLEKLPNLPVINFKLGLDLQGGSHLVYQADFASSTIVAKDQKEAMQGLRDVIERRVNLFGVAEPQVAIQEAGDKQRLVVDLSGVTDVNKAIEMIGKTPYLDFRQQTADFNAENPTFEATQLNGKYLKKADLGFNQQTMAPEILLEFNSDGAELFRQITAKNVGKRLAIFIDNSLISAPNVNEEIAGGKAQITGQFSVQEARNMVRNFNSGALPVPITLISQNTIGPSLGMVSLNTSLKAGLFGFLAVCIFMIGFYRFSGLLASVALAIYSLILLSLFKVIPVTLTLAGVGAAILSIGMAVDANVLIFERQKEERRKGENFKTSLENGFSRAWPSIRDSNFNTLIIALIMFIFGTSFVKGFAVALSLGVLVSMFSAIIITKTLMRFFIGTKLEKIKWLWRQ